MFEINYIDRDLTLRYLGVKGKPDENISGLITGYEKTLLAVIKPKHTYRVFDIDSVKEDCVSLKSCCLKLTGRDIMVHLNGCSKVILFCATIGAGADRLVRTAQVEDMTRAVILDAMCSVVIEQVCDELEKYFHRQYENYYMTRRFSPGYGDLPVSIQKNFLALLEAQKHTGVSVTGSMLMTPKKSVSAIIGLSESETIKIKKGCEGCNLENSCAFRERGPDCERNCKHD